MPSGSRSQDRAQELQAVNACGVSDQVQEVKVFLSLSFAPFSFSFFAPLSFSFFIPRRCKKHE
jgi:hypothetical protein